MSDKDFEALLRATLAERAEQAPDAEQLSRRVLDDIDLRAAELPANISPATDPLVARSAARSRQRRMSRLLVPLTSVAAVAAVVGLGLVITHEDNSRRGSSSEAVLADQNGADQNGAGSEAGGASPGSTAFGNGGKDGTTGTGASSTAGVVPLPGSPTAAATSSFQPVPASFRVVDLSFDSPSTGFALGTSPCATGRCPTLARLQAKGSWSLISAQLPFTVAGAGTAGSPVVTDIRFATSTVGYAFGPSALFITTNAGVDWTQQSAAADALEVADDTVLRVSDDGCPTTCTFAISVAPVGTGAFSPVPVAGVPLVGSGVALARAGAHAYLAVKTTSGAAEPLIASADGGQTWAVRQRDLCGGETGNTAAAKVTSLAAAADGSVTALCSGPSQQYTVTSSDGGATFGAGRPITTGAVTTVASASATTLFAGGATIYRSADAGRTWSAVPGVTTGGPATFLGFQDESTGRWVGGSGSAVWSTSDGGMTWSAHAFG